MATKFLDSTGLSTLVGQIKAEDTKIWDKLGEVPAGKTAQGEIEALEGLVGTSTVSSQIDAKLTAAGVSATEQVGTRLETIEGKLDTIQGADTVAGSINKALKDAKDYTDGKDTAMDARVDALEATHATKTGGGFQTVAEEVATGISNLRDGADAAFDTLKEIANWINNSDTAKEGFNAANRITTLEGKMDTVQGTAAGSISKAVSDEATRVNNILGTKFSSTATVTASMNAAEGEIDDLQALLGLSKLTTTGANSSTFVNRIAANESAIATLNGSNATPGSVAKQIKDAVDALDATVGSTTVATDKNVAVQVTEVDGRLTGVTVTQKDIASAAALTKLTTLVGASELATGVNDVVTRIGALESKTGTGDTATQIKTAIEALDATTFSSGVASTSGHVTVGLTQTDGKITALTVADSDVASAALLGTKTDAKTAETAFGYIAKEADRATTAEEALDARLDVIEGADTVTGSVAKALKDAKAYADAEIKKLDTPAGGVTSTGGARVSVNLVEADGIVTGLTVTENDIAQKSVMGTIPSGATATTVVGYAKEIVDAEATARANAINALDAEISSTDGGDLTVKVTEVDGKITAVSVTNFVACTEKDITDLFK